MVIGNHKFCVVTTNVYKSDKYRIGSGSKTRKNSVNWNENKHNVVKMMHKFLSFDSFTL